MSFVGNSLVFNMILIINTIYLQLLNNHDIL
jgi:hypothetical protein